MIRWFPHAMDASDSSGQFDLAVAICAFNSERTIGRTLQSVKNLARRIVVVDSGSTDQTPAICEAHGAEVIHRAWPGFIEQAQFAIDQCRGHRWVLVLDSDESLEPELRESIRQVLQADDRAFVGWYVNRKIWFMGGWLHHTFQPEWRLRLFRGDCAKVTGINPHYVIAVNGRTGRLEGDVRHDSWADLNDLAQRQIRYAREHAAQSPRGGSIFSILVRPPAALVKQLVLKRGLLDGWRGVIISGMTANFTMLKHVYIAASRLRSEDQVRE